MAHIDGTIKFFDPDADPSAIKPTRTYKRVKLFAQGELNRLIFAALRKGARPMTTGEIVASIVEALGYGEDAAKSMAPRVRANLCYLCRERKTVFKQGNRAGATWSLCG